jgi:hypothetical protein
MNKVYLAVMLACWGSAAMAAEQVEVKPGLRPDRCSERRRRDWRPWRRGWRVSQGAGGDAAQWPAADTL